MIIRTSGEYQAEVMADNFVRVPKDLNPLGYHRLTTLRIVFPRIVLAELNTHRLLSRNSASSRAIPIDKMIQWVLEHPFIPDRFPKTHTGMQASDWITSEMPEYPLWVNRWLAARDLAVETVRELNSIGISKQLANRLLEPFLMHQVIVSATEWTNFLALRVDSAAQNEIRIIAELMLEALNESKPTELEGGQWHLPFGDRLDHDRIKQLSHQLGGNGLSPDEIARRIIIARCARVSYLNFEGKDDYNSDLKLFDRLQEQGHWSPFEHVARAMSPAEYREYGQIYPNYQEYGWCGNFRGFVQYRRLTARTIENRPDSRLDVLSI